MNDSEFERQLLENRENIYRLALRITGNREEALDVVQETMLAAYRCRGRFRGESKFSTYLYRIGVNFSFAALKKRQVRHVPLENAGPIEERGPNPAQAYSRGELAERLRKMVERLPPRQKAAIHLRLYEGLSFNEVASVLGCRPATARTLYFFGIKGLKKIVGDAGGLLAGEGGRGEVEDERS